ncbi:hypothetical protein B0H14DRAFT_3099824 [Mycena olivaceomarginata]|nr:hypothetical protein B0H14DRAFT_3099824 [Mycena olivaceomarginata]
MVVCSCCGKDLNGRAYTLHLKNATNPDCIAIFAREAARGTTANPVVPIPQQELEDFDLPEGDFRGDFFAANYSLGDFDYVESDDEGDLLAPGVMSAESEDDVDEDADIQAQEEAELGRGFEPARPAAYGGDVAMDDALSSDASPARPAPVRELRQAAEDAFHHTPIVVKYPGRAEQAYLGSLHDSAASSPYAPFTSKMDWDSEIARWAKLRGSGSTAFNDLLAIEGVRNSLDLSYGNSVQLNKIIDELPTARPKFERSEVVVNGEVYHLYSRDILECVRALWGDTDFAPYLFVAPERHYIDKDKTIRMYYNMHTGKWWWSTQAAVEQEYPGATIIPIIISSDKTQLTVFGNKTAYPVYMTLGNIPKEIRRKPSPNIFHACMKYMLSPLKTAGVSGIPVTSGDGITRRGHPIYATFVGDYPEQCLVTCTKTGDCPTCEAPRDNLGDGSIFPLRNLDEILGALETLDQGPTVYARACAAARIKPIFEPFWEGLPYTNIFRSITPDILHQQYQGVVKHLISWLKEACGEAEIDARCRRLPPNHNIRLFMNGISDLNRVTGKEHDQISRFLLGIIIGIPLPNGISRDRLVTAVRGVLDFLNLAQYPMHTSETLQLQTDALQIFHENKSVFVELGIRDGFNIPKVHYDVHYPMYFKLFGSSDNYNTEYTERLHIDLAKDAYRSTNFKDTFPQMTLWLERKEKIFRHEKFIQWRLDGCPVPPKPEVLPPITYERRIRMTKFPTQKAVRINHLISDYGAVSFRDALARFVVQFNDLTLSRAQIETRAASVVLHFGRVPVFHRIKYTTEDPYKAGGPEDAVVDSILVQPQRMIRNGTVLPGRFDTAIINDGSGKLTGVTGYRVAQVRVVFSLTARHIEGLFPPGHYPPKHLAYVEWFSAFTAQPEAPHLMYKLTRSLKDGERLASIIPLENIRRSVHLLPKFGTMAPAHWTSSNVLEECSTFYVNCFTDRHSYATIF